MDPKNKVTSLWPPQHSPPQESSSRGGFDDVALERARREAAERTQCLAGEGQRVAVETARQLQEQATARAFVASAQTRVAAANQRLAIFGVLGLVGGTLMVPVLFQRRVRRK